MPIVAPLKIPYCEDCKWFRRDGDDRFAKCANPLTSTENAVSRRMMESYCTVARTYNCGRDGKYWEPRPIIEKYRAPRVSLWAKWFGRAAEGKSE